MYAYIHAQVTSMQCNKAVDINFNVHLSKKFNITTHSVKMYVNYIINFSVETRNS